MIRSELKSYDADIILLQDVDRYEEFWQRFLSSIGFDSYIGHRNDATGIGAAISWRRSSFRPIRTETIHLSDCSTSVTAASDRIRMSRLSDIAVVATLMPRRYLGERPKTQNSARVVSPSNSTRFDVDNQDSKPSRRPKGRARSPVTWDHDLPSGDLSDEDNPAEGAMISLNEGTFPDRLRSLQTAIHVVSSTLLHGVQDGQNAATRRLRCLQAKYLCHKVGEFISQYGACPLFMGIAAGACPGSEAHCALRLGRIPRAPQAPSPPVRPAAVPASAVSVLVVWPAPSKLAQGDAPIHTFEVHGRMVAKSGREGGGDSGHEGMEETSIARGGGVWGLRMVLSAADAAMMGRLRTQPIPLISRDGAESDSDWKEGPQLLAACITGLPSGSSWHFKVGAQSTVGVSQLSAPSAGVVLPSSMEEAARVGLASTTSGLTTSGAAAAAGAEPEPGHSSDKNANRSGVVGPLSDYHLRDSTGSDSYLEAE